MKVNMNLPLVFCGIVVVTGIVVIFVGFDVVGSFVVVVV